MKEEEENTMKEENRKLKVLKRINPSKTKDFSEKWKNMKSTNGNEIRQQSLLDYGNVVLFPLFPERIS